MIPEVRSYNPGRENPSMIAVKIGELEIFYSYKTPIGYRVKEGRLFLNTMYYSATSSRHLAVLKKMTMTRALFASERDFFEALERTLANELLKLRPANNHGQADEPVP